MAQKPRAAAFSPDLVENAPDGTIVTETASERAERELAEARAQSTSAGMVAPLHFEQAADDELETGETLTFGDQLEQAIPGAMAAFEAHQGAQVGAQQGEFDEIPAHLKAAMEADRQRNLQRVAADTGVEISSLGFMSQTRIALSKEQKYTIYLVPFDTEDPDTPREGSINMVPFVLNVNQPIRVPKSIVEFCVARGWCACPRELAAEFDAKNVRPPGKTRVVAPAKLALITESQRNGLELAEGGIIPFAHRVGA